MANSAIGICRGSGSVGQDSCNDSKDLKVLEVQEGKWESPAGCRSGKVP